MPEGRSTGYLIWRGCERTGIVIPGAEEKFEDCNPIIQARIIAYAQIREIEEAERRIF